MIQYLVRCARCDRAFWQRERQGPVPEHNRWDRTVTGRAGEEGRCKGSARPGHWIGEGEGPLRG